MNAIEETYIVRFTTEGQVVIPVRLRKRFHIENGTRAVLIATADGILLKPMTAALIKRGRGILKQKPDGTRTDGGWVAHKKRETALEDRHAR